VARVSARIAAWAIIAAGAGWFFAEVGLVPKAVETGLLYAAALAVLFHLARTIDPAWLISAGIVTTMFAGRWENLGLSSAIGPHRLLLLAGVFAVLLRAPSVTDRPPLRLGGVHLAMGLALGYCVVSAIVFGTISKDNAQRVLFDQIGVLPFIMFTVAPVAFSTRRQRMILLGSMVGTGGYLAITAVLEKLKLYGLVVPSYIGNPTVGIHWGRVRGPFVESSLDGLAFYVCGVASAVAFMLWRTPGARRAAAAVAAFAPVGILLTTARAAWLAAIVATVIAMITTPALVRYLIPTLAAGATAVLLALALIPGFSHQADERLNAKGPVWERENTTAAGLRMLADKPIFGFGFDRSYEEIGPYFRARPDIPLVGAFAGLHNLYLAYLVNLGAVGFGLWFLALALAFGSALTTRAPPDVEPWQVALKAILVAWLMIGLFSPAHFPFTAYIAWTWAGVVYGSGAAFPFRVPSLARPGRVVARSRPLRPQPR
jgi:O-antigen ligase